MVRRRSFKISQVYEQRMNRITNKRLSLYNYKNQRMTMFKIEQELYIRIL